MILCYLKLRASILKISDSRISWVLLCFFLPQITGQMQTAEPPPPPPAGFHQPLMPHFNPPTTLFIVLLVGAFFFLGFFSVYIRQCVGRGMSGPNFNRSLSFRRLSRRLGRGLDPELIESFPVFLYSAVKRLKIGMHALECAVCLNEFEDDETLRLIPNCSHVFHPDCIGAWLKSHTTCPLCRADLLSGATVQIFDPDPEPETQPENWGRNEARINVIEIESPEVALITNQAAVAVAAARNENRPPRSRSTGWRLAGFFPRSHSTGHSLIQRGEIENLERFRLRLQPEARRELMSSTLNRTMSCVALPRAASSRRGYRSRSGGRYELIERPAGWGSTLTPPFFTRIGSIRSSKLRSCEHVVRGEEEAGERPSDQLREESQV